MKAYAHESIPAHWIVEDGGDLYLVPAIPQGWQKRALLANRELVASASEVNISQLYGLDLPLTPFVRWLAEMGALHGYKRPMDKKEAAELIGISQDSATKYARAWSLPRTVAMAMAAASAGLRASG